VVIKDPDRHQGVGDLGDQAARSSTAWTDPRFDAEDSVEKVGPRVVTGWFLFRLGGWLRFTRGGLWFGGGSGKGFRFGRHDPGPQCCIRCQHSMVGQQVTPRWGHKSGEPFHKGQRSEAHAVGAVFPGPLEIVDHIPFRGQVQARCGDWRAGVSSFFG
jgi:hypothetical protein